MAELTDRERIELLETEYGGLKAAIRLTLILAAILVVTMVVVSIAIANHQAKQSGKQIGKKIRHDINLLAEKGCRTSTRAFIEKHNSLVDEIVRVRTRTAEREQADGQIAAAADDRRAAARYRTKRIHVPTDQECSKPILKP